MCWWVAWAAHGSTLPSQPGGAPVHPPAQRLRRDGRQPHQGVLIAGSRLRLTEMKGATVSVFPYGTASCTVTYQGLLYPLAHDTPHQRRRAHGREQHHHRGYRRHPGPRGHGLGGGLHGVTLFAPLDILVSERENRQRERQMVLCRAAIGPVLKIPRPGACALSALPGDVPFLFLPRGAHLVPLRGALVALGFSLLRRGNGRQGQ